MKILNVCGWFEWKAFGRRMKAFKISLHERWGRHRIDNTSRLSVSRKTVRRDARTAGSKPLSDSNLRIFSVFWKGSNKWKSRAISGYRCDVDEIGNLLGCYATCNGMFSPKVRGSLWVPSSGVKKSVLYFLTPEDGTNRLFPNVGKDLPLHAA